MLYYLIKKCIDRKTKFILNFPIIKFTSLPNKKTGSSHASCLFHYGDGGPPLLEDPKTLIRLAI